MTNEQLYLAVGIPMLFNAAMIGILIAYINAKFDGFENGMNRRFENVNRRFEDVNRRFDDVNRRFEDVNRRFDDMRDLWRSELHRVEEVLDARLKHLEGR